MIETITDFFDTNDFATACVVGGDPVNAIFTLEWVEVTLGQTPYSGAYPTLTGAAGDFAGKLDAVVTIGAATYKIIDIQPDGTGVVKAVMIEQ